ncbi:MAG: hypothetical protein HC780_11670 [Leptolyngbyaceae cyanobacterium CSU_1_3]|nr:hypothetical protein [Leptolyngbyaceae cyanobacterium CSU_1_3]
MNGRAIANTVSLPNAAPNLQMVGFLKAIAAPALTPALSVTTDSRVAITAADALATAPIEASAVLSLNGLVTATDPNDFYRFNLAQSGVFTASLAGLTGDADVRLLQDKNQNGAIDPGEILAWQWERGSTNESIRRFLAAGDYFVQVMGYNGQTANYSLATGFTPAVSDSQAFEFGITFGQSLSALTQAARDAIASAAEFWESLIISRSAITRSNRLDLVIRGESLTTANGSPDTGTLALSGPQFDLDGPNLVISGGISTINLRRLAEFNANPGYLRDIMVHELGHILGLGTLWEPVRFANSGGTIFEVGKTLIDRTTTTYRANTYAGWVYGELLKTFTQMAIPIEAQIFAHWDEGRFDTELMTPFAETPGVSVPTSQLTLAALRDLGWNVNMGAAQAYALSGFAPVPTMAQATVQPTGARSDRAAYRASCACRTCLAASKVHELGSSSGLSRLIL